MTSEFPKWLQEKPLACPVALDLPQPSLADNTADVDRLARALALAGFAPVRFDPRRMVALTRRIREENFRFTAVVGFSRPFWHVLDILPQSPLGPILGFSVDLGTSSIVVRLIDLAGRKTISEVSVSNPQVVHGEDILSRILFARTDEGRSELRRTLIAACADAMRGSLAERGFSFENVYAVACAGNTAMSHFLAGLDASNLCKEPYIPAANTYPTARAEEFGLDFLPNALLYLFPNVGSYVGGDIISGILATGLHRSSQPRMLIDVGTNAEVVLGCSDWLLACAGAAGPALEGGVVERGMQAFPGAIDRVRIDRRTLEPSFRVIGNRKPCGICGSGLIDLMAEMFSAGILTVQGKIGAGTDSARVRHSEEGRSYMLVPASQTCDGREISISEIDIGIFLKSKAAMYTILSVISGKVGLRFSDIKRIFIAGNFGNRIDPEMAVRIGMIPDLPLETYCGIGNSSALGASMALLDRTLLDEAERIRGMITYVELNVNLQLMNEFRGALFLPHTNRRLFPSVRVPQAQPGAREKGV